MSLPYHHMLVEGAVIRITKGPKEHHTRPSLDPLFRSAALSHGSGVIGLVMTGTLNDGTAGLQAIKACGGRAVVQDPDDAIEPSMPLSALASVEVDHQADLNQLPQLLAALAAAPVLPVPHSSFQKVHAVQDWFLGKGDVMETIQAIASPSTFVCPDCKGALWEIKESRPKQLRCHAGHAFTLQTLQSVQAEQTDEALWGAVRAFQE
jgi:two-component system, chemotaxis family, protein-glutamate methylesterase/glutaminase